MDKQIKYSRQREAMLELIKNTECHPDAAWLYEKMKDKFPNISLATVYRNLRVLIHTGDITHVEGIDGTEHYDGNIHAHYHFICKVCGNVSDMNMPVLDEIKKYAEKYCSENMLIEKHSLVFYGVCKDCLKK